MKKSFLNSLCVVFLCFIVFACFACSSPQEDSKKHASRAKEYFTDKDYGNAKIEYLNAIQLDPQNDAAHFDLGETYVHLQDPFNAATSFSKAIAANPDNLKARLRLGQILLLSNETKQAREAVNKILEKQPNHIEAMHLLSSIQIQERNLPLAVKTLKETIALDPSDDRTYLFLAHLLAGMNALDDAEGYYLKAIELNPRLRAAYMEVIDLYRRKGEISKIEPLIVKWANSPGERVEKSNDLGLFQESQDRMEEAEKTFLEAVAKAPDNPSALVNLGSFYARHNKREKALQIFKQALDLDKENPDIQADIATLAFENQKFNEAETAVDSILSKNEKHEQANFIKGRLYLNKKDFASALKHFDLVIGKNPKHAMARYFKAICLLDPGQSNIAGKDLFTVASGYSSIESWERNLAIEELEKALNADPGFFKAKLLLIEAYLNENKVKPARELLVPLLQKDPGNIEALILGGKLKLLENDPAGAVQVYEHILKLYPDYASGYVTLGLAHYRMKDQQKAIEAFSRALEINPKQMDALNYIISIYMQENNSNEALAACSSHRQKFIASDPGIALIDLMEGKVRMTIGETEKAKALFEKSIELKPDLFASYEELAMIHERLKNEEGAIQYYEKLLKLKPDYLPTYLNIARIYKSRGDMKKAEKTLRDVLAIRSDYPPAANNLAYLLAESKSSLYEALRLAKVASEQDDKNSDYLDTLGWVYYLQGNYDLAIRKLEESLKLNPDNPISHFHLGWAYYDSQKYEEARKHMAKALELDPNFKGADEAKGVLGK